MRNGNASNAPCRRSRDAADPARIPCVRRILDAIFYVLRTGCA